MEALRQWALSLIAAALAGTFACIVIPGGSMEKTVKAISGIFVVCAICSPLGQTDFDGVLSHLAEASEIRETAVQAGSLEESTLELCKQAVKEAVLAAAKESEVAVTEIDAELEIANDGIIIHSVSAVVESENTVRKEEFLRSAGEKLGFPIDIKER